MFRFKYLWFLFFCSVLSLLVPPAYGEGIGKALDEALKSRVTSPLEEVVANFQNAAGTTANPRQRANVLSLLADFLIEKQEWAKAIEVDERILAEGTEADKPGAYYGEAQAYLMLNRPEKARAICARLKADHPDNTMESFANYMKGISPNSIHARLADFLAETPGVVGRGPTGAPSPAV